MDEKTTVTNRRALLGLAAAAASMPIAGASAAMAEALPGAPAASPDGYRETPHVRAAYDRMRF